MMKRKILILALALCMLLALAVNAQAKTLYDEVEEPAIGGKYYLCATVDGVDYYYRVTNSTFSESVTDTIPYSFYVTSDPDEKGIKEFTLEELGAGFYMGYPSGDNIHKIYSFDVDKDDSHPLCVYAQQFHGLPGQRTGTVDWRPVCAGAAGVFYL